MSRVLVELFAGTGAITNGFLGYSTLCSRQGCKQGYFDIIAKYLGDEKPEHFLLVDTDPGLCKALKASYEDPLLLADRIEWISNAIKDPRHCWDWAMSEKDNNPAAFWLATSGRYRGVGNYRGKHKNRPKSDGCFSPSRIGLQTRLRERVPNPNVGVINASAGRIEPIKGNVAVYIDNVYEGTSPYDFDVPVNTEEIALDWALAGADVVVSEGKPLTNLHQFGFMSVEITDKKKGQSRKDTRNSREFLTYFK